MTSYTEILKDIKQHLHDSDLRLQVIDLREDLRQQINAYKSGKPIRRSREPRYMLPVLEGHKQKVRIGLFRWDPYKEIRALDRILEAHSGSFTPSDHTYMARRRTKAIENVNTPSPRFRAVGERQGGFLTESEQKHVRMWRLLFKLYRRCE